MFSKRMNRVGAVAVAVMHALTLASPASATGRTGWGEARELAGGLWQRVALWLGVAPAPGFVVKCDHGSQIDPNGCLKAGSSKADDGSKIDPDGRSEAPDNSKVDEGSSIDPNGKH